MNIEELKNISSECTTLLKLIKNNDLYYELSKDFLRKMDLTNTVLEDNILFIDNQSLDEVKEFLENNIKNAISKDIGNFIAGIKMIPYSLRFLLILNQKILLNHEM